MGGRVLRCLQRLLMVLLLGMVSSLSSDSIISSNGTSSRGVSYLREKPQYLSHLLKRQKRWLMFEEGSSVSATANCVKAVLDTNPKGLVVLAEMSAVYSLPSAIEDWLPRRRRKPTPIPAPPPPPPSVAAKATPLIFPQQPSIFPLSPADPVHSFYYSYPQFSLPPGHRKSYEYHPSIRCPGSKLGKDLYGNYYCLPTPMTRRLARELKDNGAKVLNEGQSPHGMLFDLLIMLSEIHQYQPRYCIMRTLCESRHLLAPPGQLLFHDIFRILLRYVYPEIAHKPPYLKAFTAGHSLHQCAQWYAAHCPQSFLLLLSKHFRGKLSNIFN